MFRIEPRGYNSRFWRLGSPILAIALTILVTGVIFAAMGQAPGLAVYTFLVAPLLEHNGLAALAIKAAPLIMIGVGLALCYRIAIAMWFLPTWHRHSKQYCRPSSTLS